MHKILDWFVDALLHGNVLTSFNGFLYGRGML